MSLRPKVGDTPAEEPEGVAVKMINHLMTPGSSLTSTVWTAFNVIMVMLGMIWLVFLFNFPTNTHVLIFGGLFLGLFGSTNWFFSEIFNAKEDFESQKERGEIDDKKKTDGDEKKKDDDAEVKAVEDKPAAAPASPGTTKKRNGRKAAAREE